MPGVVAGGEGHHLVGRLTFRHLVYTIHLNLCLIPNSHSVFHAEVSLNINYKINGQCFA